LCFAQKVPMSRNKIKREKQKETQNENIVLYIIINNNPIHNPINVKLIQSHNLLDLVVEPEMLILGTRKAVSKILKEKQLIYVCT
jgi:hypothetical protein